MKSLSLFSESELASRLGVNLPCRERAKSLARSFELPTMIEFPGRWCGYRTAVEESRVSRMHVIKAMVALVTGNVCPTKNDRLFSSRALSKRAQIRKGRRVARAIPATTASSSGRKMTWNALLMTREKERRRGGDTPSTDETRARMQTERRRGDSPVS